MRDFFSKKAKVFAAALWLLAPLSTFGSQAGSFQVTDTANRKGADTSLQHSTVYAMNALMDLGNLNINSAVNNGMTAYGKYRNAETMDRLGDENIWRSQALASLGAPVDPHPSTDTTFRRLDPKFLREGKFGEVASEFERRSGMQREKFLSHMSEISENKISRRDPQLVNKAIGRFERFVAQIPNDSFREKLQKGVNMVPESARTGIISKAVAKFADLVADDTGKGHTDESIRKMAEERLKAGAAAPAFIASPGAGPQEGSIGGVNASGASSGGPSAHQGRKTASAEPISLSAPLNPKPEAPEDESNPWRSLVQTAIDAQEEDVTIFQLVSRRYRIVTPLLSKTR